MITCQQFKAISDDVAKWGTEAAPCLAYGLMAFHPVYGVDAVQRMARVARGENPYEDRSDQASDEENFFKRRDAEYDADFELLTRDFCIPEEEIGELQGLSMGANEDDTTVTKKQRQYMQTRILPLLEAQIPDQAPNNA